MKKELSEEPRMIRAKNDKTAMFFTYAICAVLFFLAYSALAVGMAILYKKTGVKIPGGTGLIIGLSSSAVLGLFWWRLRLLPNIRQSLVLTVVSLCGFSAALLRFTMHADLPVVPLIFFMQVATGAVFCMLVYFLIPRMVSSHS